MEYGTITRELSEMTVSEYIRKMAAISKTPQHEVILDCLGYYDLYGTRELTLEQAAEFWEVVRPR